MGTAMPCIDLDNITICKGSVLIDSQQQSLINLVTSKDIRKALLDIGNDKTLGLDGYGAKFFI